MLFRARETNLMKFQGYHLTNKLERKTMVMLMYRIMGTGGHVPPNI